MPEDYDALDELLNYFETTYIQRRGGRPGRYKIKMWNMYDRVMDNLPRSNNSIESWHSQIHSVLSCASPTMWKCLNFFQKEFQYQEIKINILNRGEVFPQKKKYKDNDDKIRRLVEKFEEKDPIDYLSALTL